MQKPFKLFILSSLVLFVSCAGIFSGFRSSSTKTVRKTPYYSGKTPENIGKIGHFPVEMDVRLFEDLESRGQEISPLIDAMNEYVDGLELSEPLVYIDLDPEQAPDIYVGNRNGFNSPASLNTDKDSDNNEMVVYQKAPSNAWKDSLMAVYTKNDIEHYLYITIGFSEYFVRIKNLLLSKELQIGTGYTLSAPWLSNTDMPAEVLHVTGALLDKNGKISRCGSEGIIAKQTGFWSSMIDVQDIIASSEIQNVLENERRQDIEGNPLSWQVAINNLVVQLLSKNEMIIQPQK